MRKIISGFFIALLVATSIFGFSACGAMTIEEIDVSTSLSTKKDYLLTNVYNKTAGTDFNIEGANYVTDVNYFVTVKTGVTDILTSITIGGVVFEDDDTVSLSVGNDNYLIRNAWKVESESLKIASGLLLSSTTSEGKVVIIYGGKNLTLKTLSEPSDVNFDVTVEGTGATIAGPTAGVYTYTSNNYAGYFKIKISSGTDENLLARDTVIAVEKIKKDANGGIIGITYGLTKTDLIGDEYFVVYYPAYNAGDSYTAGNPANYTMEFRFLVLGVGADSFTYNFVNSAT